VFLRWFKRHNAANLELAATDQCLMGWLGQKLMRLKQAFGKVGDGMLEPQRHLVSWELKDDPENNAAHVCNPTVKQ
jgi:hypothetical protein